MSSRFPVAHVTGDAPASIFGFATFPSSAVIDDMFDSEAYQALVPDRDKSVESVNAYIVEDAAITARSSYALVVKEAGLASTCMTTWPTSPARDIDPAAPAGIDIAFDTTKITCA